MLFYICLFIITVSLVLFTRKKVFTILAFVLLSATFAVRDVLAVDDLVYIQAFEYINLGWDFDIELSYKLISHWIYQVGMNYKAVFFIYGTLSIFFLYKAVNIFCNNNFQKAVFLAAFFGIVFITSMSVMRQFLAGCIVFYAIALYIRKDKALPTLLLMIFASFFHYSAIIAIVMYFLLPWTKRIPEYAKMILPVVCLIIGYLNIPGNMLSTISSFLPDSYRHYSDSVTGNYSSAGGTMHYILLAIFIAQFLMRKNTEVSLKSKSEVTLELGQMIYLCLNFLLAQAGVASRLSFTFMPFIATLPYTFMKNFNIGERKLIGLICIACMFGMLINSINGISSNGSEFFIPYRWSLNFWSE